MRSGSIELRETHRKIDHPRRREEQQDRQEVRGQIRPGVPGASAGVERWPDEEQKGDRDNDQHDRSDASTPCRTRVGDLLLGEGGFDQRFSTRCAQHDGVRTGLITGSLVPHAERCRTDARIEKVFRARDRRASGRRGQRVLDRHHAEGMVAGADREHMHQTEAKRRWRNEPARGPHACVHQGCRTAGRPMRQPCSRAARRS